MENITAKEYWKQRFDEYPNNDCEKLAVAMMQEYANEVVKSDCVISSIIPCQHKYAICECNEFCNFKKEEK